MKKIFRYKRMYEVNTQAGPIFLLSDGSAECPWCKTERVILGRVKPGDQWIPVKMQDAMSEVHELHKCEYAVKMNNALRHHLQMKPQTEFSGDEREYE